MRSQTLTSLMLGLGLIAAGCSPAASTLSGAKADADDTLTFDAKVQTVQPALQAIDYSKPPDPSSKEQQELSKIRQLIEQKADLDVIDPQTSSTLLCEAAKKGYVHVCSRLLENGAKPSAPNARKLTPLYWAVTNAHPYVVKRLLDAGAKSNEKCGGVTPMHACAIGGSTTCMQMLIDKGGDVGAVEESSGRTPLYFPFMVFDQERVKPSPVAMVKLLLAHKADPRAKDRRGNTALHIAALNNEAEAAKLLIDAGADVNARDGNGSTPLHWAAESKKVVLPDFSDVGVKKLATRSFLASTGDYEHHLTETDAEYTEPKTNEKFPIYFLRELRNLKTTTAWIYYRENLEVFKVLLEKGADAKAANNRGATPEDAARSLHAPSKRIATLIQKHNHKPSVP